MLTGGIHMNSFQKFVHRTNFVFQLLAGILVLVIVAALGWDLVARNVFNAPTLWAMDLSRLALLFLFFLAIGPALESGSHVAVDILNEYLTGRPRWALQVVAQVLVIVFACFLLWEVTGETYDAFVYDGSFPTVVPVKMKYVYWIGPFGVLQFLLTALSLLWTSSLQTSQAA